MADLSDIEIALTGRVFELLYPNGADNPGIVSSVVRIYRGWPTPAGLNADLASGATNITISPTSTPDEVLGPYLGDRDATVQSPTLFGSVTGETVTFSGGAQENAIIGLLIDGRPYEYLSHSLDTPSSIAANLACQISVDRPAIASNSSLIISGLRSASVRIFSHGVLRTAVRRSRKDIAIICWAPGMALRDEICATIDGVLSGIGKLTLQDGTQAILRYLSTQVYDQSANSQLFRRDLVFRVEYSSISSTLAVPLVFPLIHRNSDIHYS